MTMLGLVMRFRHTCNIVYTGDPNLLPPLAKWLSADRTDRKPGLCLRACSLGFGIEYDHRLVHVFLQTGGLACV